MMDTHTLAIAPDWVQDAIFYQIFPDRFFNGDPSNDPPGTESWGNPPTRENFFGGDLQGVLQKLDYLQNLGVNAIYLNPIFQARTNHRYDTCDYFQVDPTLGSNALLEKLAQELHRREMRIILDGVFNHCGDGFWAFEDVKLRGQASPYSDWFFIRSHPIDAHAQSYDTCGGCPYLPKLNPANPVVRDYLLKVGTHWLEEAHIDGWRLDTACKVPMDFWQDFRAAMKAVNPNAYLVGEIWREADAWVRGDIFDGVTNYLLRELILGFCLNEALDAEDFAYEVDSLLKKLGPAAASMLNLLGSHDTPRALTLFRGELDRFLIAVTFLMTTVGAPLVYYGDEIGMHGGMDPDCRRTMNWDEGKWDRRIFETYRQLIALRRSHEAFRRGKHETLLAFNRVYAYRRASENDEAIIVLNPGPAVPHLAIPTRSGSPSWQEAFSKQQWRVNEGRLLLEVVPPMSCMIFLPENT